MPRQGKNFLTLPLWNMLRQIEQSRSFKGGCDNEGQNENVINCSGVSGAAVIELHV